MLPIILCARGGRRSHEYVRTRLTFGSVIDSITVSPNDYQLDFFSEEFFSIHNTVENSL